MHILIFVLSEISYTKERVLIESFDLDMVT